MKIRNHLIRVVSACMKIVAPGMEMIAMMRMRQRSILARIEGQLARLACMTGQLDSTGGTVAVLHWQRIEWACKALRFLLAAPDDIARCQRLLVELAALRQVTIGSSQFRHRSTLLRADCLIWQMRLR